MSNQLSKEETINQFIDEAENDASCWTEETIYKAMDTYAKQECIAFAEWIKDEYEWCGKWNCWIPKGSAFVIEEERLNSEQLFHIYQQSKQS